jgi:hypothetical protein
MAKPAKSIPLSRRTAVAALVGVFASGRSRSARSGAMTKVVLLGDSVFDNASYVGGAPDVRTQLASILPADADATLLARDGAVIADVMQQIRQVPRDGTHLVISAGGNNALGAAGVLNERAASVADALNKIAAVGDRFRQEYRRLLDIVLDRKMPAAVCTIYEPRFPEAESRRMAATALTVLNNHITAEAFARNLAVIDLRIICDREEDFANPIEPSAIGGEKIARAIAAFATDARPSALIFGRQ